MGEEKKKGLESVLPWRKWKSRERKRFVQVGTRSGWSKRKICVPDAKTTIFFKHFYSWHTSFIL